MAAGKSLYIPYLTAVHEVAHLEIVVGGDLKTQPLAGEPKETVVGCVTEILQIDRRDVVNKSACLEKRLHGFNVLSPCFELV